MSAPAPTTEPQCCLLILQESEPHENPALNDWRHRSFCKDIPELENFIQKTIQAAIVKQSGKWTMMSRFLPSFDNELDYSGIFKNVSYFNYFTTYYVLTSVRSKI